MKKFTKIALGCTIGFAAIGLGLSAAGIAMGAASTGKEALAKLWEDALDSGNVRWSVVSKDDTDWDDLREEGWDSSETPLVNNDRNVYEFSKLRDVEIELSADELYFKSYDGEGIRVETDDANDKVRVKQDGETLKIKSLSKLNGTQIVVYYPTDMYFQEMDIEVDAGEIHFDHEISVNEMEIQVGAGSLVSENLLTANELNLNVGAGNAKILSLDASSLEAECGMGELNLGLAGDEEDYSYKVECGLGSVQIGDQHYSGISETAKVRNEQSYKNMEIECGLGEVIITFGK